MSWLIYVSLSIILFTALNLIQRTVAVDSNNPRASAIIFNTFSSLLAIGLFVASGAWHNLSIPTENLAWLALIGGVLFYGLFERGRFTANKLLEASTFAIVINLSVLIAFISSIFLYAEQLTLETLVGGSLVIISLLLVSYEKQKKSLDKKGLGLAILISISLGLAWSLDKMGTKNFGPELYSMVAWVGGLLLIILPLVPNRQLLEEFQQSFKKIGVISLLNVAGYYFMLKALETANATQVIPLDQSSLLLTVFLGIILLKERDRLVQKIIAGILGLIGVFLLV